MDRSHTTHPIQNSLVVPQCAENQMLFHKATRPCVVSPFLAPLSQLYPSLLVLQAPAPLTPCLPLQAEELTIAPNSK